MKMDCVDINLLAHSQQVPVHPLSLEHGQPRQVCIEPPIDRCAVNNMQKVEKAVIEMVKMLSHLRRRTCQTSQMLQSSSRNQCIGVSCLPYDSLPKSLAVFLQLSYLSTLLTEDVTCIQSHTVSSSQINLESYLLKTWSQPAERVASRSLDV